MSKEKIYDQVLKSVKLHQPSLFRKSCHPKFPVPNDKKTYNTKFLLDKNEHADTINSIMSSIKALCKENKIPFSPDRYRVFEDLAPSADADDNKESLRNYFKLSAKSYSKPKVVKGVDNVIVTEEEELIQNGDIVHAYVIFSAVPKSNPTGISCSLETVKFAKKGEPIVISRSAIDASDKFSGFECEEGDLTEKETDLF
jgi:hypothetical protein